MFEDVMRWLQNVCRTCIVEYDVLHDISEIKDRSYLEFVESFADVIMNCGDGIPNKLCSNCMEKLQTCIDFKVQIQKSDLYLRSKLNNTNISNENNHFTAKDIDDNDDKAAIFLSEEHSNGSSVCRDKNIDEAIQNELRNVERICEVGIKSENDYEELDNPLKDILLRKSKSSNTTTKTSHKRKVSKGHITKKGRWNLRAKRTILKEVELKEEVSSEEEEEKKQWVPKAKIKSDRSPYSYIKTEKHRVEFPCNMCIKVFPNETQLDIHMATHDPNKPFICNLLRCRRQFATEKEFMVHQAVNHSKDLVCPVCNKQFSAKHNMRQHMVSHRESKRHKCNVCGKGFNYRNHLKNHELIHTPKDDTPHLCQQCGKKFRSKENFRQHMLRHRTTKPHKCLFCPKTFILPTYLRLHMKRHTGENDFLCQTCGKQLFSQVNLKKHVKSHLPGGVPDVEEERHLCGICVRSFKKKAAFEVHMKTHESGARIHKCDHCSWYFTSTSLMRDHVKNRHSNIMKPPRKRGVEVFPKNVSQEELAIANASTLVHSTAATTHANKLKLKLQHQLANLTDTDVHAHTDSQYEQVIPTQVSPVNIAQSPDSNASNSVNTVMMGQYVRLSEGEATAHCVVSEHSEESNNSFINNQGNSNDMQPEQIHYTTITICPDGGENQYAIVIKK